MMPRGGDGTLRTNSPENLTIHPLASPSSTGLKHGCFRPSTPSERGRWASVGTGQAGKAHRSLGSGTGTVVRDVVIWD